MARFFCHDIKVKNGAGEFNLKPRTITITDEAIRNDLARHGGDVSETDLVMVSLESKLQFELGDKLRLISARCDKREDNIFVGCEPLTFGFTERCYGGPEEGGWWYDSFEPIRVYFVSKKQKHRLLSKLTALTLRLNEGEPELSSVNSRGLYTVYIGMESRTIRPRYS